MPNNRGNCSKLFFLGIAWRTDLCLALHWCGLEVGHLGSPVPEVRCCCYQSRSKPKPVHCDGLFCFLGWNHWGYRQGQFGGGSMGSNLNGSIGAETVTGERQLSGGSLSCHVGAYCELRLRASSRLSSDQHSSQRYLLSTHHILQCIIYIWPQKGIRGYSDSRLPICTVRPGRFSELFSTVKSEHCIAESQPSRNPI